MQMRVGELARRTGVGVSTLRAWETRFKFLQPQRSPSGQRLYVETDVGRVDAVLRLVAEGLTLPAAIARVSSAGTGALPDGEGEVLLFAQILEAVGQGVWVSKEGRTRYANRRMAEMLGYTVDELLAKPVLDVLGPEALPQMKERGALGRAGKRLHFTHVFLRADGSTFVGEVDTTPLINQAGRYEGAVALVNDVTDRVDAETQARFRAALLDSIGDAVAAADPEGRLVYINAAAERLFGWRAADVIGRDGRSLMAAPDVDNEALEIHQRLLGGDRYSGALKLRRLDGTEFIGHLTSAPAFDDNGELLGLIAVITDQTERIRLDRERQAIELQRETVSMLGVQALRLRSDPGRAATLILTEGIDAVRRLLEADHVTIFEVTAGSNELRVIAGHPTVDEPTAVPSGSRSLAGYVALARKVVVVEDALHDRRFEPSPIRPGFRPASAIGAPIFGPNGIAGVLTAESSILGRFGNSAGPFAQSMATIIGIALLTH